MHGIELFFSNTLFGKRVYSYFLREHPKILEYWKIHPKNFDFNKFQKKYFTVDYIQDISANPSSNVTNKSIARFKVEMITPFIKYLTFSTLFEKMVEMYGVNEATEYSKMLLDGTFYLHDTAAYIMPYCLGVDFSKLLLEGMPYGQLHSLPPKKPRTFINQVKEAIIELSNEFAGAIAFPSLIVLYTYIYLKYYGKDCKINKKEVKDDFQNLVHTINKELRNGQESPFSNLSFFDRYILDELLTYVYSYFTNEIGDKELFLKRILEIQEIVMEFLCKGDPVTKAPYRFPVLTSCFIKDKKTGKILDREFLDLVAKNNTRGQMNIYVSDDARKYSMCCLHPDEKVLVRYSDMRKVPRVTYTSLKFLWNRLSKFYKKFYKTNKTEEGIEYFDWDVEVLYKGKFVKARLWRRPLRKDEKLYKVKLSNNLEFIITEDHLCLTDKGIKLAKELTNSDYIPLSLTSYEGSKRGSYDLGYFIGLYIAEGCKANSNETCINFSFGKNEDELINFVKEYSEKFLGAYVNIQEKKSAKVVVIQGKYIQELIAKFVGGKKATEKFLKSEVFTMSKEFRKGIIDGWFAGDGSSKGRIITYSKNLMQDLCTLYHSLGFAYSIVIDDRKKEDGKLSDNPAFLIKKISFDTRQKYGDYFYKKGDYVYFRIKEIEKIKPKFLQFVYDFEILDDEQDKEHLFELANGIVTHNCRFQPDYSSVKFDSFGNGGINVGSCRVLTINLNRIALEVLEPIEEKDFVVEYRTFYLQKLEGRMSIARRILDSFRECIRDFIKQGCYRFFNLGWFDLDKHFYSTIGFIGLYEALRTLDEDLRSSFAIDILETMDDMITEFNKNGKIKYNLEQVPGESAAGLLPSLDKYFYGEEKVPYVLYSNQFVPLYERHSILDKIEIEGRYFKYLSGGGISHINILHEMKPEEVKFLIELCVEKGIEHFALNPVYSICENGHYLLGKYDECYICGAKIKDHLTRVVGFFTPVSAWSKQRREWEFSKRVWNTLKGDIESEKE